MQEKIQIRRGIELGLQPHLAGFYEELTNQYPFDFVIGSVHVVHGMDPYYGEIFEGRSDEEVYKETFLATLENLDAVSSFDVLGHLDYVVRYGKCQARQYSYKKYAQEIDEILKKVIAMGKGIERIRPDGNTALHSATPIRKFSAGIKNWAGKSSQ